MAWEPLGWKPQFFSEIEAFPCAVLAHHYGSNLPGKPAGNGVPNHGDMTKFKDWPHHAIDLLVGGTPCQSFSVAGLRAGLADPRGNLMLTYLAVAAKYQPRWLLWENVPGVLSSYSGAEPPGDLAEGQDWETDETSDFGCLLSGFQQLGYGFAYRVLDAQFCRALGYAGAVPQRRRRVFVVGYLGDWRRAAAVLFDGASLRGDPPPRRETGQRFAPTISARTHGGGGLGTDFDLDGGLIANSGNVGYCLTASAQQSLDAETETETLVAHAAPAITGNPYGDNESREGLLVAHALRAEGFDASEDGTGRGTPIVPVVAASLTRGAESSGKGGYAGRRQEDDSNIIAEPLTLAIRGRGDSHNLEYRQDGTSNAILTPNGGRGGIGVGAIAHQALPINMQIATRHEALGRGTGFGVGEDGDPAFTLTKEHHHAIAMNWAVRRLTPTECERLQGFPDGYTAIQWRGKPAADGPRYKALGNSMAVNCMRVIGTRIAMVEAGIESAHRFSKSARAAA